MFETVGLQEGWLFDFYLLGFQMFCHGFLTIQKATKMVFKNQRDCWVSVKLVLAVCTVWLQSKMDKIIDKKD